MCIAQGHGSSVNARDVKKKKALDWVPVDTKRST